MENKANLKKICQWQINYALEYKGMQQEKEVKIG